MNDKGFLNILRGIVRPGVALVAFLALVGMAVYLVVKFADREVLLIVLPAFLVMVTSLTERYFASREAKKK